MTKYHKNFAMLRSFARGSNANFLLVRVIFITMIILSTRLCLAQTTQHFRFPAEFEEHNAVWVGWGNYTEGASSYSFDSVSLDIVEALVPFVKVKIPVCSRGELTRTKILLQNRNIPLTNVSFLFTPCVRIWWRDFGPIFVTNEHGNMKIVDFDFNFWGYMSSTANLSRIHEKIDRCVAKEMKIQTIMTRLVSEGGDREFNGKGTMLVVESVELQRNPNMSKQEIEDEFKRVLGVKKIIWLKNGVYNDQHLKIGDSERLWGPNGAKDAYLCGGTGGHVDEFCRFVSPNTIVLAQATAKEAESDPIAMENRRRMEENFEILTRATDQDENHFKIVRIPIPETEYVTITPKDPVYQGLTTVNFKDGHSFPLGQPVNILPASSYCNFLITNGVVLAAKYWEQGKPESIKRKDKRVVQILQSLFPLRKIIAINPLPLNLSGGGIHCCTQQEPAIH